MRRSRWSPRGTTKKPRPRPNRQFFPVVAAIAFLSAGIASAQTIRDDFYVTDGSVETIARDGNTLYIGGTFSRVGPATGGAAPLSTASGLAQGVPKVVGTVEAVASDGAGGWYIGGVFTQVGGVPRSNLAHLASDYSVTSWAPQATGDVYALAVRGGVVYVGGNITGINGQARDYIAAVSASTGTLTSWNPDADGIVYALAISGTKVYAAGAFFNIGGQSRLRIAALSAVTGLATSWNPSANSIVYSLALGRAVYAGGFFSDIGGATRTRIAALDSTTGSAGPWNPGSNGTVHSLALGGANVYAGGEFTFIGGQTRSQIAAIDTSGSGAATSWNPGANGIVHTMEVIGSNVYAGGAFTFIGGAIRNFLAAVSVSTGSASSWDPNPSGQVNQLAVSGSTVFAGGNFSTAGGVNRSRIAAIDVGTGLPTAWNPNANGTVNALAVDGNVVYAGGGFTGMDGVSRNRIAALSRITGAATPWNPNSGGLVVTLVVNGATVYAGGTFLTIGGASRNQIAALDATTGAATAWNPGATGGTVLKMILSGTSMYVCGTFSNLGGAPRNYVGAVEQSTGLATSWNPNPDNWVYTMALDGGTMYLGGEFLFVGGQSRQKIAAVDAATGAVRPWNPGAGSSEVRSIVADGAKVFVGGAFSTVGGQPRSRIALVDAATGQAAAWNPGANGTVRSMLLDGTTLYAGGDFTAVGPLPMRGLAAISIPSTYDALIGERWNGDALVVGSGGSPEILPDGAGGALMVWESGDSLSNDLKALRLAADGRIAPGWSPGGLVLCDAVNQQPLNTSNQRLASAVADGKGGLVSAWLDYRGTTIGIRAQRVSGAGELLWAANGAMVGPSDVWPSEVALAPAGDGGAIVTWSDTLDGNHNIYASRLLADGSIGLGWGGGRGAPVVTHAADKLDPAAVSDGKGGAIITWRDQRVTGSDIYAQRLSPAGVRQWSSAGNAVCTEDNVQSSARMISDGRGGAIVWWLDSRDGSPRLAAQRLDSLGTRRWPTSGVLLSATGTAGGEGVSDGLGGAIFVWRQTNSVYAQRVNSSGVLLWGAAGIQLAEAVGPATPPTVISDGIGGAIVTWESNGTYSMRVNADGSVAAGWGSGVSSTVAPHVDATSSWATPDGTGGALIAWRRSSGALCLQRVKRDGGIAAPPAAAWKLDGTAAATPSGVQQRPAAVSTGQGGTILIWEDYRNPAPGGGPTILGPGHALVTGIKLLDSGDADPDWVDNGNELAPSANNQLQPVAVSDNLGGALVAWTEVVGGGSDIRAQHILSNSSPAQGWPSGGLNLHTSGGVNSQPAITTDGIGGAIVVWERAGGGTGQDIIAQRVRANGQLSWGASGLGLCNANGNQSRPVVVEDGSGGAYVAWTDGRGANTDIYGVHVDSTGTPMSGWTVNGSAIVLAAGDQDLPAGIANGFGGAIFLWRDARTGGRDIYAQRCSDHVPQVWTSIGVAVVTINGDQGPARLTTDGVGGAIVAWEDLRAGSNGTDLYATRVLEAGNVDAGWNANGVPLCMAVGNQLNPQVVPDGQGGAVVFWEDDRSGSGLDIYAMGVQGNGTLDPRYPLDGLEVSTADGSQTQMVLTTDGNGGALVAWYDGRGDDPDIYAMHLFGNSAPSPLAVGDRPVHVLVALAPPWPNPSRGTVSFAFEIATPSAVRLDIVDVSGRRVRQLVRDDLVAAGSHVQRWDGRNSEGGPVSAGIYFAQLRVGSHAVTRRFALTR